MCSLWTPESTLKNYNSSAIRFYRICYIIFNFILVRTSFIRRRIVLYRPYAIVVLVVVNIGCLQSSSTYIYNGKHLLQLSYTNIRVYIIHRGEKTFKPKSCIKKKTKTLSKTTIQNISTLSLNTNKLQFSHQFYTFLYSILRFTECSIYATRQYQLYILQHRNIEEPSIADFRLFS